MSWVDLYFMIKVVGGAVVWGAFFLVAFLLCYTGGKKK